MKKKQNNAKNQIELGEVYPLAPNHEWKKLSGELPNRLINDYMFRALLQSDNETLRALIAALLHLDATKISAQITNPILLGRALTDKYFVLDVKVIVNEDILLNLEMQVIKNIDWKDRSLGYLCRLYDHLNRGDAYVDTKQAIQICFLNFTLFDEEPEFYATYRLMNEKDPHRVYSDKFRLSTIDLTRIDLATKEDIKYHIDEWAGMFKARTWEELKMIVEKNKDIERAISVFYQLTQDEEIMEQARQREEFLAMQAAEKRRLERMTLKIEQTSQELEQVTQELDKTSQELEQRSQELEQRSQELDKTSQELDKTSQELEQRSQELEQRSQERDEALKREQEAQKRIKELERMLAVNGNVL